MKLYRHQVRPWVLVIAIIVSVAPTALWAEPIEPTPGRWTSVGNGPSHSGFYPATLGNGPITPGWSKSFGREINPVAVSDGRVFATATNFPVREDTINSFAVALDSNSGQELWRYVLPAPADAPIVNGDNVLVEAEPPWAVYALRCTDGLVKWIHPFIGIVRTATTPTTGDHVWLGFQPGYLLNVRISDNLLPSVTPIGDGQGSRTKTSYYNGVLYATDGNILSAVDPETGAILWTINASFGYGYSFYDDEGLPVIANGKASGLSPPLGSLTTVDLETRSVLWNVHTFGLAGLPASDGSTVYAFYVSSAVPNGPISVKAYEADTGTLLGEYALTGQTPNEQLVSRAQPLVTNDTVLVATDSATYVFDKASFTLRTRLPVGGSLSYAAGTLYIVDPSGNLLTYKFASAAPEPAPPAWPTPTPPQPPPKTDVELISVNRSGNSTAAGNSAAIALSANGRYVVFQSAASDLTSLPDTNNYQDYFLRDRQTGNTVLITANSDNTAAATGNVDQQAAITPDGRFVVFASQRYDLVLPVQHGAAAMRVYVRDMKTNKTTLVGVGQAPHISNDGRYVLFCGGGTIVSVRDLLNQTTIFQYGDSAGEADANAISGDGRYILFSASSTQITSGGYPAKQCYLHDLVTQTTTLVSVDLSGTGMANEGVNRARMSDDGQFVIFDSRATNLASPPPPSGDGWLGSAVYRRDMHQGVTEYLTRGLDRAAVADISNDGAVIAVVADPLFSSTSYLADTRAGTFEQLPYPSPLDMDPSGRLIAFLSGGSGGVAADINNMPDIFLYDHKLRTTKLISHNLAGTSSPSGWAQQSPIISDDGQTVAFSSTASDLVITPKYISGPGVTYLDAYVSSTPQTGHLQNISTRAFVQTGDNVMIGGLIVTGSGQKKVILRAIGPSLSNFGIANALQDPVLELHDSTGALIASNDNWIDASNKQAISDSGLAPSNNLESAILTSLNPSSYTAIVHGVNNGTGVALVEAYDLDQTAGSKFTNISTRAFAQTGDNVMIGGLIVTGSDSENVIVRAIGPSLTQYGIANALADPMLELHDSNGNTIASNDNWIDASNKQAIIDSGLAPSNNLESAILTSLNPGSYTAIVHGVNNGTGVALVEVFGLN
jgi:Tol biopolymer transport system component